MQKIKPEEVLYIKLGRGGKWEEECIRKGTLRLGYVEVPHKLCLGGKWRDIQRERTRSHKNKGAATSDTTQIRRFYESGKDVLWVTFWKNSLWWCFSRPKVILLHDKTKTRPVIGKWKCQDIEGRTLLMSQLSGIVLAMQGFRGTICSVKEDKYLVNKINGIQPKEVKEAEESVIKLERNVEEIVHRLTWHNFELLINLM